MGLCSFRQEHASTYTHTHTHTHTHKHKHTSHTNTLSSCSGKLPGSHARLYGYGSHGEREWTICGVLLTGPKESRPKLR